MIDDESPLSPAPTDHAAKDDPPAVPVAQSEAKSGFLPKGSLDLIRRFWPFMRPHRRYLVVMAASLVLGTPLALVSPLIIQRVVDDAVGSAETGQVWFWGGVLVALTVAGVLLELARGWSKTLFEHRVRRDVQLRLHGHVQSMSHGFYSRRETGYLMSRLSDDVDNLEGVMADAFLRAGVDAVTAVAYLAMLFYVEWRMATGGLVLVVLIFALIALLAPELRRRSEREREAKARLGRALHQSLTGHGLTRAVAAERHERRRFANALHHAVRASVRRDLFALGTDNALGLIAGVAPTLIVLGGVALIVTGELTVGGLFAFFMYLLYLFASVAGVAATIPALQSSLASLDRIFELLDTAPEVRSPSRPLRLDSFGDLELEKVGLRYENGEKAALEALDLHIEAGRSVAVVGPSGAGKTTLAHLVMRFFDPTSGRLTIGGHDLTSLDLRHYRRRIGLVPQQVFLFDRTVAENIAYGSTIRDRKRIIEAAEAASAREFIEALPRGFDTPIGEGGIRLSGGQRQRLAIAREFLRDPELLILDEATSALDSRTEAAVQHALERLLEGRTSMLIAHRLSTVRRADHIAVLDGGRLVQYGTHESLRDQGLYGELCDSQLLTPAAEGSDPSAA